jgi:putative ABC transport system permease protein
MIRFLFKGLIRDRSRSLFPFLTVLFGVLLTVVAYSWVRGIEAELVRANASFATGHVKIMSRAYAEEADQLPNELALMGVDSLLQRLRHDYPDISWNPRIRFAGLLDVPDAHGETRAQGPVAGLGVDLLSLGSTEPSVLNLATSLVRGVLPTRPGDLLVSEELATRLGIALGETATLISATMHGSMATANFRVTGTVRFGVAAMDRGAVIADYKDIQQALDMPDATGEILGFFPGMLYRQEQASKLVESFNRRFQGTSDEYAPIMITLRDQAGLAQTLDLTSYLTGVEIGIFVVVMSIVLWNAGLMGSLRRYGEIGIRMAMGEAKGRIYRSMIAESLMIGLLGSAAGTLLGVAISYYLQEQGINIASMMKNASMMLSDVMRAQVTPTSFVIGFIPGLLATLLGTSISGIGIYQRQTSQLTKELEA